MQCECRENLEAKLRDHVAAKLPEGYEGFHAKLEGFGFGINQETLTMTTILMIPYKGEVLVPKKTGDGMKKQKINTSVRAMFCPFCGQPTEANEAA